jgi:hypothetical protein
VTESVNRQLVAYLIVCSGVGAMFGSFGGVPGLFDILIPRLWLFGGATFFFGLAWFFWEVDR